MIKINGSSINEGIKIGKLVFYTKEMEVSTLFDISGPVIIAADMLTPNDTVKFKETSIAAFAVKNATAYSHVSILSRTMGLPAVSNVSGLEQWNEKTAIVDGYNGLVIIEPDEKTIRLYREKIEEYRKRSEETLDRFKTVSAKTLSGKELHIYANINAVEDIDDAISYGAEGIGVFKTEFIYLNSANQPSENDQFLVYKSMAEKLGGKKLVIRTFDIGVDKIPDYFHLPKEENPALGYRGIRISLDRPAQFKTQLRAILRASAYGNVSVLYPMIVSVDEVLRIKCLTEQMMSELKKEGAAFNSDIEQGIMIETPASVLISEELAREVDFFSIGTNDLTQYTLAVDRQNPMVEHIYDSHHLAILRSIKLVVENAKKAGIWTSISGELGADSSFTKDLIDCGIDALTVSPSRIIPVKKTICELD